jgi:hypothetical protein
MSNDPSRASAELRRAATSQCPGCRRDTKTVEGVCAECWEPKQPGARVMRPELKRTPIFDFDIDPIWIGLGVAAIASMLIRIAWSLAAS